MTEQGTPPESALHRAARLGDLIELDRLLAAGADINARADLEYDHGAFLRQLTPLMIAACSNDGATVATLRWLVERGADWRAQSEGGVTAAWYAAGEARWWLRPARAAATDRAARLQYLLDLGLDPQEQADNGRSLLVEACRAGDPARVALLLARGAAAVPHYDVEQRRQSAARDIARHRAMMIEAGVPAESVDEYTARIFPQPNCLSSYEIPLFCAAESGAAECVRMILAAGAAPDTRDNSDRTPLMCVKSAAAARVLIEAGADLRAVESFGHDVLDVVLRDREPNEAGAMEVAQALIDAGVELDRPDANGWSRLYRQAFETNESAVGWLLKQGADARARLDNGQTPLHAVCWNGTSPDEMEAPHSATRQIITLLVNAGADIDAQAEDGYTPLHVAVCPYSHGPCSSDGANPSAVSALLQHGAQLEHSAADAATPLLLAVRDVGVDEAGLACVRLLLAAGAQPQHRDQTGQTALDYARRMQVYWTNLMPGSLPPDSKFDGTPEAQMARWQDAQHWADECVRLLQDAAPRQTTP